jgi:hypothetical protein
MISLLKKRGGKGVCIDFEGVSTSHKTKITAFMKSLANQVHSSISGSIVTICLPAVEWSDKFDVAAMQNYVDYFVIMGYDYYYSGSSQAGPVGPLYSMTSAYNYNLNKSITTWTNKGASADKIILGLPYYGREWSTRSSSIPSSTTGSTSSRTFKYVKDNSTGYYKSSNRRWNSSSFTPYYVFQNSGWRQCFIDDGYSMGKRIDLINQRNLAGMGIWALGYDDGYSDYWDQISKKLSSCKVYPVTDTIYDSGGPEQKYYNNDDYVSTFYAPLNTEEIAITFKNFELEDGSDFLYIYSGEGTDNLIGTYTGSNSPGNITVDGNSFTIKVENNGSGTYNGWDAIWRASSSTIILDDFENGSGHFTALPTYSGITEGISTTSTLEQQTSVAHNSNAALKAVLADDNTITDDWIVRLLSGMGDPAQNIVFGSEGTLSFWMRSESAGSDATVQIWIDDVDGLEVSPAITVNNDGLWHQYTYDLSDFKGSAYTAGNGNGTLEGNNITLDAITLKQSDNSQTWTIYIDDVVYARDEVDPDPEPVTELQIPVLLKPENKSVINNSPVSFSWSCPTTGAEYKIQISTELESWKAGSGFSKIVLSQNVKENKSFEWECRSISNLLLECSGNKRQ